MNISQLQPLSHAQVQRISTQAGEKDADFLALRLLNKRARVRISPEPFQLERLPGKGRLFAVANSTGWFAAVACVGGQYSVALSPLSELHNAFSSTPSGNEIHFAPRRTVNLSGTPNFVIFAFNDSRLLVSFIEGTIIVFDARSLFDEKEFGTKPLYTFPSDSVVREILPNPGDIPELVAVLRQNNPHVEILDVQQLQSVGGWQSCDSPNTTVSAVSWSPKGKQLALGLENGDIVTFSPSLTSTAKTAIPAPPSANGQSIIYINWLSNTEFYAVYAPPGPLQPDVDQTHVIVLYDSKAKSAGDTKLSTPYLPFPGLRPPGLFTTVFRNWEPARFLIIVGDGSSSDIGVIGNLSDPSVAPNSEGWYNLSMEESSTPALPLDKDMNDTVLLGLELDLTARDTYRYTGPSGEETDLPPPPIMFVYASDGTINAWHVINTNGVAYHGMTALNSQPTSNSPVLSSSPSTTLAQSPSMTRTVSANMEVSQDSPVQPTVSSSPFGSYALPSGVSPFAQASLSPSTSASPISAGFGAFAGTGSAKFGQTGFSNNGSPVPAPPVVTSPPTLSTAMSTSDDAMISNGDTAFGGLSLGGDGQNDSSSESKPGVFGQFTSPTPATQSTTNGAQASTFGSSNSFMKPPTGFGTLANYGVSSFGSSPISSSASVTDQAKPSPAFGKSGFETKFGQPAFGQPSFGQPAFGQSSFGQTASAALSSNQSPSITTSGSAEGTSATTGTARGFSAFAQTGPSAFGSTLKPAGDTVSTQSAFASPSSNIPSSSTPRSEPTAILPRTPTSQDSSPSLTGSPVGKPLVIESESDAEALTTPKSSDLFAATGFKSSGPAVTTGAFGQLKTSAVGFGMFEGSGAFGNSLPNKSSPFYNPPQIPDVPKSVFTLPSSVFGNPSTTPKSDPSKPTFGSTSKPGSSLSAFGKSPIVSADTTTTPTSGGFSAFSSARSAFSSVSSSGKSFSELLKQKADDTPEVAVSRPRRPGSANSPRPSHPPATEQEEPASPSLDASFDRLEDVQEADEEDDDDGESFISEPLTDDEEDDDEDDDFPTDEQLEAVFAIPDDLLSIPLPASPESSSRSPSATPQPDSQPTEVASPVEQSATSKEEPVPSPSQESTTPLGSPAKQLSTQTIPAAVAPNPLPPTFSLGLGRPSTRPARSSPLASAPIVGQDDDNDGESSSVARPKDTVQPSRPKTPPLLSTFPSTTPKFPPPPQSPAAKLPPFTLSSPMKSINLPAIPPAPLFPTLQAAPPDAPKTNDSGLFGMKQTPSTPPSTAPTLGSGGSSIFSSPLQGFGLAKNAPSGVIDKGKEIVTPAKGPTPPVSKPAQAAPSSGPSKAQGMQVECERLLAYLGKELQELQIMAQAARQKQSVVYKPSTGKRTARDLGNTDVWALGDAVVFGQIMLSVEKNIAGLKAQQAAHKQMLRTLEGGLLKATARKEEVVRFNRASTDTEFAKMLKARTLGPDHLEMQTQLRREIRLIRDRVQKLEDQLQEYKKRLKNAQAGTPGLRPPSLDTINRAYRNIDMAIEQQKSGVDQLASRVAKLNLKASLSFEPEPRDQRLPDENARHPTAGIPNVAATTAAALNAERSAQKLKQALLRLRKEPLLNVKAISAPPAPMDFKTPSKPVKTEDIPPLPWTLQTPTETLDWEIPPFGPDDSFSPLTTLERRHRTSSSPRHAKSVPLKKTSSTPLPPPVFSFGPLPGVAPKATLSADVRKPDPELTMNALSNSWVSVKDEK